MATNNAVNTSLSGQTGTGNFVGATSPTLVTPTIGAATATSVTFSPTTSGIAGTTTNDNASAGFVGEVLSNSASTVSVSTGVAKTITSLSLTAGDWDVWGNVKFTPAGTTTISAIACQVSGTDNTLTGGISLNSLGATFNTGTNQFLTCGITRIAEGSTTTVYVVAQASFGVSTMTCDGQIFARRRR